MNDSAEKMGHESVRVLLWGLIVGSPLWMALSCTEVYNLDYPDIDIPAPDDLETRLSRYRSGEEKWHGDPRTVADVAIRRYLDVPWKADPFRPGAYEVKESPEWGAYVVRGYPYPNGEMRYRVKVRAYGEIWYPIQVSHYKAHELPHPALED